MDSLAARCEQVIKLDQIRLRPLWMGFKEGLTQLTEADFISLPSLCCLEWLCDRWCFRGHPVTWMRSGLGVWRLLLSLDVRAKFILFMWASFWAFCSMQLTFFWRWEMTVGKRPIISVPKEDSDGLQNVTLALSNGSLHRHIELINELLIPVLHIRNQSFLCPARKSISLLAFWNWRRETGHNALSKHVLPSWLL